MKQKLENHIARIADPALRKTCETILHYEKFFTWPASLGFHHAYEGGLLAHTVEVCDTASGMLDAVACEGVGDYSLRKDILIASALWHDVMKVEEYILTEMGKGIIIKRSEDYHVKEIWIRSSYQTTIGHIVGSAAQFQTTAVNFGVNRETIDAVTHCVLAHHGRKEWGSPVEPQTLEALLLHQADMLSAKYGATK